MFSKAILIELQTGLEVIGTRCHARSRSRSTLAKPRVLTVLSRFSTSFAK
jgi:hypothetical protein